MPVTVHLHSRYTSRRARATADLGVGGLARRGALDDALFQRRGVDEPGDGAPGMKHVERHQHWDTVYRATSEKDLSWFEAVPEISLRMLDAAGLSTDSCVLDVGGGESRLIDHLAARGVRCLAVLDISATALQRCRSRLGASASVPIWIEADVTGDWSLKPMDIWHDRAVFHFLTAPADRARYRERLLGTLKPGGNAIIATFALDGPEKCSGLPVQRYSPRTLAAELGERFAIVDSASHVHTTPWGSAQSFQYSRLERLP